MVFILRKIGILFIVAMVLAPCLVEAFNFVGGKMFPESMDCISMFRELLGKESYEFKEVFMTTVGCNPLFGWFKNGNQLFASSEKIVSGTNALLFPDVPILESDATPTSNESGRSDNEGHYDWCFHFAMYLSTIVTVLMLIDFILWDDYFKPKKRGLSSKQFRLLFTPLESPAGCSGDEDKILFRANTGFKAPCEPTHWKVEDLLTGFTFFIEFEKSIHGLLGKFRGIEVKVELNDRDLLDNVHL